MTASEHRPIDTVAAALRATITAAGAQIDAALRAAADGPDVETLDLLLDVLRAVSALDECVQTSRHAS